MGTRQRTKERKTRGNGNARKTPRTEGLERLLDGAGVLRGDDVRLDIWVDGVGGLICKVFRSGGHPHMDFPTAPRILNIYINT